ncbi:MAG: DUF935 family protein [Rhodospirillales bacterium]|nr:DUF935 family protein [Rhodospirillales bacterium]
MATRRPPSPGKVLAGIEGNRDITRGYLDERNLLQPQDDLSGGRPPVTRYRAYRSLLQDDRVGTSFRQRRSALIGRSTEVRPGGDATIDRKAADFVRDAVVEALPWDRICNLMLFGTFYGLSVAECVWMRDGAHVVPEKILVRDRGRFAFGGADGSELRLVTPGATVRGETMPERKFWVVASGGDHDDEPYGLGLGWETYWPVFLKRQGVTQWADLLDRFARPIPVGHYQREADIDAVYQAVEAVRDGRGAAIPASASIDLLEALKSGRTDYRDWLDVWNRAITLTLIGQTMTTEDGSSRSQAEVHWQVRRDIVQADDDLLADTLRAQVLSWLIEWNYPGAAVPRIRRVLDDPPDTHALSERDLRIWRMGWAPTGDYIGDTYDIEVTPRRIDPAAPGPGGPGESTDFAAEGPAERPLAQQAADAVDPLIARWPAELSRPLAAAATLAEWRDGLTGAGQGVDIAPAAEALAEALAAARLAGMYDVWTEAEEDTSFADVDGVRLGFAEQIAFFREKLNLGTNAWTDIWEAQHDRSFVVAGAARDDLVADLKGAVEAAISDGETLETFRARFDEIVERHGWAYKGDRLWRTRVIYNTNIATSYSAGRWTQANAVTDQRPYWRYRHSPASEVPRPDHETWDGLILRADDPWWLTHWPPNGWGCQCWVETLSMRDMERHDLAVSEPPPMGWHDVTVGPADSRRTVRVPAGVDAGFGYAPGASREAA